MLNGQDKLNNYLENVSISTLPRTIILSGKKGCGKHTFCYLLRDKIGQDFPISDISDNLNYDFIIELYMRSNPNIYIIDCTKILQKEQNKLLKFLEEPLKNSYVIILCESLNQLLGTIINRCAIFSFQPYTRDQLRAFDDDIDDRLLDFCDTPGDVISYKGINIDPYTALAQKIIDKMHVAAISNALSISDKIAFKDESDKLNLRLFNKVLLNACSNALKEKLIDITFFNFVRNYLIEISQPRVNQKYLVENLIINLWLYSHEH